MPLTVLVTGIAGFVGSHFAEYALGQGAIVVGSRLPGGGTEAIAHLERDLQLLDVDLREPAAVRRLVDRTRPDWIIHLAAQSFVGTSWDAPAETLTNNVLGQLNLLEAVRAAGAQPRCLVVGSGDEYGDVQEHELPIHEDVPFRPLSPYAISKVAQDLMGYQYWRTYGLPVIRSRAFNHEGPRRGEAFVTSSFARQIVEIEAQMRPPVIRVGNLKSRRDFTDVRDIVRGYWRLLQDGRAGQAYNLCSGRAWSIRAILDFLLAEARVGHIEIRDDPALMRPVDVPVVVGDAGKILREVGWRAEIPFEQTLRDMLEYWREHVAARRRA
ncbi:MAG TPA: GDP-mannose 4,6-dehydratase [Methylomirabilota bacterium]